MINPMIEIKSTCKLKNLFTVTCFFKNLRRHFVSFVSNFDVNIALSNFEKL